MSIRNIFRGNKVRGAFLIGSDALLISAGRYGQFAVTFLTLPLIARNLSTSEFGVYAIGSGLFFLGSIYSDWGLSLPLGARLANIDSLAGGKLRANFFLLRLCATLPVVLLYVLLSLVLGPQVFVLAFLAGCASSLGEEWLLTARGKFVAVLYCQWIGRLLHVAILVFVLPQFSHVEVIFVSLLLSSVLSSLLSWLPADRPRLRSMSGWASIFQMIKLGFSALLAKMVTNLSGTSVSVLLSFKFSFDVIGVFSGSDRLVRAGVAALDSLVVAQFPRVSAEVAKSGYSRRLLVRVCGVAMGFGLVGTIGLFFASTLLSDVLYAGSLPGVEKVMRTAAFLIPAAALVSTLNTNVFSVRQSTLPMLISAVVGGVVLVALLVSVPETISANVVAACVVIGEWCAALVSLLLAWRVFGRM